MLELKSDSQVPKDLFVPTLYFLVKTKLLKSGGFGLYSD